MNYWHMQLFPGRENKDDFPPEKIRKILKQIHYIGMGEEDWSPPTVRKFREALQIGDIVLIRSNGPLALCKVTGNLEYKENPNGDFDWFPNRRKVEILSWIEDYEEYIGRFVDGITYTITFAPANNSEYIKKWYSLYCKYSGIEKMKKLLELNKNLILTGAPGTGKTYLARQIAMEMIGVKTDEELDKSGQFAFVQFHPSYDYTDFVEGLRPVKHEGDDDFGFILKAGIFMDFCNKAKQNIIDAQKTLDVSQLSRDDDKKTVKIPNKKIKNFVFVIDEINRGEISKIFGELFFSIEPSYRGIKGKVKTQYSNMHNDEDEEFYVPENVYIIGTMNDIDRSVESFDFAMRRRFAWVEISAEQSAENMDLPDEVKGRMQKLNAEISKIEGLNSSYHIGGAYYLDKDGKPGTDHNTIWELRLEPLLKEYLRGMAGAEENLKNLKKAYYA